MSVDHLTWFIIPLESFTEGRFAETMDSLRHLPNSMIAPYDPADPDAPLFSTGRFPSPVIDGIDTYGFGASTQWDPEDEFRTSLPYGVLDLMTEGKKFFDNDLLSDAYAEVLGRIFTGMGAVYASCGSNQSVSSISNILKICEGLHIFSDEIVEAVGRDVLEESGFVTEIDGGLIVRTNEDDIYGGPYGKIFLALTKVGEILGIEEEETIDFLALATSEYDGPIHGESAGFLNDPEEEVEEIPKSPTVAQEEGDMLPTEDRGGPVSQYQDLVYSPYSSFVLLYCRAATDLRSSASGFFNDLMSFDASEEKSSDQYWLRPDRLDQLIDELSYGKKTISRFKRSFTTPPTRLYSAQLDMVVTAGAPGQPSYGPQFEREGAISVFMGHPWGDLESLHGIQALTMLLQELQLVVKHFRPVHGLGMRGLEGFNSACLHQGIAPDSRIWPINVFDLNVLGHEFEVRLKEYWTENADRWMLQTLHDRTVVLMAYDPDKQDDVMYDEATRAIIGEMGNLSGPIDAHLLGSYYNPGVGGP